MLDEYNESGLSIIQEFREVAHLYKYILVTPISCLSSYHLNTVHFKRNSIFRKHKLWNFYIDSDRIFDSYQTEMNISIENIEFFQTEINNKYPNNILRIILCSNESLPIYLSELHIKNNTIVKIADIVRYLSKLPVDQIIKRAECYIHHSDNPTQFNAFNMLRTLIYKELQSLTNNLYTLKYIEYENSLSQIAIQIKKYESVNKNTPYFNMEFHTLMTNFNTSINLILELISLCNSIYLHSNLNSLETNMKELNLNKSKYQQNFTNINEYIKLSNTLRTYLYTEIPNLGILYEYLDIINCSDSDNNEKITELININASLITSNVEINNLSNTIHAFDKITQATGINMINKYTDDYEGVLAEYYNIYNSNSDDVYLCSTGLLYLDNKHSIVLGMFELKYYNLMKEYSEPLTCTICLNDLFEHEPYTIKTECNHLFHYYCLKRWKIESDDEIKRCPNCRQTLQN